MERARKLGSIVVSAAVIARSKFAPTPFHGEAAGPARRRKCERANLLSLLVLVLPGLLSGWAVAAEPPTCDGQYHWVDVAGTECLDGSPTGIVYRCTPPSEASRPLLIYTEGGGACWITTPALAAPTPTASPAQTRRAPLSRQTTSVGVMSGA